MGRKTGIFAIITIMIIVGVGIYTIFNGPEPARKLPPRAKDEIMPKGQEVSNVKEGWGFIKSKDHQTPEITAHQKKMIKKYNCIFVGDTGKRKVALTFDMGYEKEGYTEKILETLEKNKVKATFFTTGYWLNKNENLAKRIVKEGHLLANHTWLHKSLPTLSDEEIKNEIMKWDKRAREITGRGSRYIRPPMGEYSERSLRITKTLGYTTVFWSIALVDWLPMDSPQEAVNGVVNYLHNGAVILLHGNSDDVVTALDDIIKEIIRAGYEIVPLDKIQ